MRKVRQCLFAVLVLAPLPSVAESTVEPDLAYSAELPGGGGEARLPRSPLVDRKLLLDYLVDKTGFTLIDARSSGEYEVSRVDGAINIPHDAPLAGHAKLPADLGAPILVYCRTGMRAGELADSLLALGYTDVRVLPSRQLMFYDELVVFNCGV